MKTFLKTFLTIFAKYNIKFLHYVTETKRAFVTYLFVAVYGMYGPSPNILRSICLFSIIYLLILSLLLFLICNTTGPRKFLSNLVGEDFIIKYLF